jgi:iron complex transport system substrate-binding protein
MLPHSDAMRIASIVPSATEMLFALGLGESVVAVTHECDFPPEATDRARLTRSVIPDGLSAAEIDAAVRERTSRGEALYELDEDALPGLDVDLIVTQAVCAVCAVSYDDVRAVAARLPSHPRVLSLDPSTLDEVLGDVETLAAEAGVPEAGGRLLSELRSRLDRVAIAIARTREEPRVAALEWLDPPYVGGHWVPDMIGLAGGADPFSKPGSPSRVAAWEELAAAGPEVAVVMPCGLYADEAREQALAHREHLASLGASRAYAVDAASTFSRPGPRLVDGVELLAYLLHPTLVDIPAGLHWHDLAPELRWESAAQSSRSR